MSSSRKRHARLEENSTNVSKKPKTVKSSEKATDEGISGGGFKDAEGNEHWEIAEKRRVTISEFRGKRMISIREYYEKDGQVLPGKKGISLPLSQFSSIVSLLPHIESALKEKGESFPRPDYSGALLTDDGGSSEDQERADDREKKRNFEETSDEN